MNKKCNTFNEWLEHRDPEFYSEVDWQNMAKKGAKLGMDGASMAKAGWDSMGDKARSTAKKAALGGAIGMSALGVGNNMLGPSDMDLVQKHFPNVVAQELSPEELDGYVAMAKAGEAGQAADEMNKKHYLQDNGQKPDGGFRDDIPTSHYQNPYFRK